jgi:hypothetical protein
MDASAWKGKVDFGILTIREDEAAAGGEILRHLYRALPHLRRS